MPDIYSIGHFNFQEKKNERIFSINESAVKATCHVIEYSISLAVQCSLKRDCYELIRSVLCSVRTNYFGEVSGGLSLAVKPNDSRSEITNNLHQDGKIEFHRYDNNLWPPLNFLCNLIWKTSNCFFTMTNLGLEGTRNK